MLNSLELVQLSNAAAPRAGVGKGVDKGVGKGAQHRMSTTVHTAEAIYTIPMSNKGDAAQLGLYAVPLESKPLELKPLDVKPQGLYVVPLELQPHDAEQQGMYAVHDHQIIHRSPFL